MLLNQSLKKVYDKEKEGACIAFIQIFSISGLGNHVGLLRETCSAKVGFPRACRFPYMPVAHLRDTPIFEETTMVQFQPQTLSNADLKSSHRDGNISRLCSSERSPRGCGLRTLRQFSRSYEPGDCSWLTSNCLKKPRASTDVPCRRELRGKNLS